MIITKEQQEAINFVEWLISQDITRRGKGLWVDEGGIFITTEQLYKEFNSTKPINKIQCP